MPYRPDTRQRASESRQYAIWGVVRDYGRTAPAALAQRDFLEKQMAHNAQRRALGQVHAGPGLLRRWLGARMLAFGARLAGAQTVFEPIATHADEPVPTRGAT